MSVPLFLSQFALFCSGLQAEQDEESLAKVVAGVPFDLLQDFRRALELKLGRPFVFSDANVQLLFKEHQKLYDDIASAQALMPAHLAVIALPYGPGNQTAYENAFRLISESESPINVWPFILTDHSRAVCTENEILPFVTLAHPEVSQLLFPLLCENQDVFRDIVEREKGVPAIKGVFTILQRNLVRSELFFAKMLWAREFGRTVAAAVLLEEALITEDEQLRELAIIYGHGLDGVVSHLDDRLGYPVAELEEAQWIPQVFR